MTFWGIVVAAGAGRRFGRAKHEVDLAGKPLWRWARDCLADAGAGEVVVVGSVPGGVPGGERRRDSVAAGLARVPGDVDHVLVHDAARPLATAVLAGRVLDRLRAGDVEGVVPALLLRDAVKHVESDLVVGTADRSGLAAVQTPQGFVADALRSAHAADDADAGDDAELVERAGGRVATVPGEPANLKVTFPDDLAVVASLLGRPASGPPRVGWGCDAHPFGGAPPVRLGGVVVDESRGLAATSDGDVLAHAVADAMLGAAALGDLGDHFPSSDPRWRGADSMELLRRVVALVRAAGYEPASVDTTVIAETVRVAPHRAAIQDALAAALGLAGTAVSVKATSTDGMGFVGRDEGVAATATAVLAPAG